MPCRIQMRLLAPMHTHRLTPVSLKFLHLIRLLLVGLVVGPSQLSSADVAFPTVFNTQEESIPLLKPEAARDRISVPEGFEVTLFASEPAVQQPIAITTDARGRLWVAENYTYSENAVNFHPNLRDRIVILEDTDQDGRFDRRTVFWDKARKLTSVAVGLGGVFALCPPHLLFIPDQNGDDVPDAEPQVLLDGWSDGTIRHTIVNGLKWGPDGWLYGRHGIQATSEVGVPGTPAAQRVAINVGLWRYHPASRQFEVVAQGTTNPWGHDWDEHGQLFFINTVIGHLWHVVPGAYYKRMYGEHFNPRLYELIDQTADHFHWDTREIWHDIRKLGVTPTTSEAGGGHAHSGLMIYLGDNWPASYRNSVFAVNYHGKRLNQDRLERRGAGYVGKHAPDFLRSEDPWFRGIDLLYGPDGGVFVADWSDIGECHDHDGIHRTSGRIYKVTYGKPKWDGPRDLRSLPDAELVRLQMHRNDWFVRQARLVLQERFLKGADMAAVHRQLSALYQEQTEVSRKLRALWCLSVTGGAQPAWLRSQLASSEEHLRVWAMRLLTDREAPSPELLSRLTELARTESSGLVLAFLASTLQRVPPTGRWALAEALGAQRTFAADPTFPLLVWYGLQPSIDGDPDRAVQMAETTVLPKVRRFITRQLAEDWDKNLPRISRLTEVLGKSSSSALQEDLLGGMTDALRGLRRAKPPTDWSNLAAQLMNSPVASVKALARELSVVFGDGRALEDLRRQVADTQADLTSRRQALRVLVQSRAEGLVPLAQGLLGEIEIAPDAVQALGTSGAPEVADILLKQYRSLRSVAAKAEAVQALASRPAFATRLLEAVTSGAISRADVGAVHLRQLRSLGQAGISQRVDELWPLSRPLSAEKQKRLAEFKARLLPESLARADASNGRKLFQQACASCHKLFGEGGQVGPDLTGSDRRNLDYLLDNLLDPSGVVPENFRMSVITLKDGRVVNGLVGSGNDRTLNVQSATEKLVLERAEVESVKPSSFSMMPEGLVDALSDAQLQELVRYLMSPGQVPLP